jgi:LysM repeat protein
LVRGLAAGGVIVLTACGVASRDTAEPTRSKRTPASTAAAPTTTTAPMTSYQVKRGDTLTAIAKLFGVSKAAITAANQLSSEDRLTEGQVLQIPPTPPAQLVVDPPDGIAGHVFTFMLTGAKAGEIVTFEIVSPDGGIFTGSPHTAGEDGVVRHLTRGEVSAPGVTSALALRRARRRDLVPLHVGAHDVRRQVGARALPAERLELGFGLPPLVDVDSVRLDRIGRNREVQAAGRAPGFDDRLQRRRHERVAPARGHVDLSRDDDHG